MVPSNIHHQITWGLATVRIFWNVHFVWACSLRFDDFFDFRSNPYTFSRSFSVLPTSTFFWQDFFQIVELFLCFFGGHLNAHKNMSHPVMFDWSSFSDLLLEPMVLFKPFSSHLGDNTSWLKNVDFPWYSGDTKKIVGTYYTKKCQRM